MAQGRQDKISFPTEDATRQLIYPAVTNDRARLAPQLTVAQLEFKITYGDRVPGLQADTRHSKPSILGVELQQAAAQTDCLTRSMPDYGVDRLQG